MTTQHDTDLDRMLGDWLGEGTTHAPEPPKRAALDHARAHPRRRDVLAAFRADPMPRPGSRTTVFGFAPATLVVAALTVALAAGAVYVASQPDDGTAPLPIPPSPTAAPSPTEPPPYEPAVRTWTFPLVTGTAATMNVTVIDRSGLLWDARSGDPATMPVESAEGLDIVPVGPALAQAVWIDAVCSVDYTLELDREGRTLTLTSPPCEGDAMAVPRIVVLVFNRANIETSLEAIEGVIVKAP